MKCVTSDEDFNTVINFHLLLTDDQLLAVLKFKFTDCFDLWINLYMHENCIPVLKVENVRNGVKHCAQLVIGLINVLITIHKYRPFFCTSLVESLITSDLLSHWGHYWVILDDEDSDRLEN